MGSKSAVFLTCATLAWVSAAYKVTALRRQPHNPGLWALTASIVLPAMAFTIAAPTFYPRVDHLLHVPNIASLIVYGCIATYSATALIMLLLWYQPATQARRRSGRILLALGCVLAAMTGLFLAGNAPTEHPDDFDEVYAHTPLIGAFLLIYVAAFAVGLTAVATGSAQFAHHVTRAGVSRRWLRRGLRLVAAGSVTALGYCAGKAILVVGAWSDADTTLFSGLGTLFAVAGALLITAGFTIPSWGPRLWAATTYLRLYPLWKTMYQLFPDIALHPVPSRWADLPRLRDLDFQLYRRLVEINDGRAALTTYPTDTDTARAVALKLDPAAYAEATAIAHAATAPPPTQARPPSSPPAEARPPSRRLDADPPDIEQQLLWLLDVGKALRHLTTNPTTPAEPATTSRTA